MDENGTYSWPGGQNTRPKKKPDFKRVGRTVIAVAAALLVLAVALTCFYTCLLYTSPSPRDTR